MDVVGLATCRDCGVPVGWSGSLCILCRDLFCADHLVTRKGVATCRRCVGVRRELEATSAITDAVEDRLVTLLSADLTNTVGTSHEDMVTETVARYRLVCHRVAEYHQMVVDDVQQQMHDGFIDTSWPACPYHPKHPLWFLEGHWRCERDGIVIAVLGSLTRVVSGKGNQ